MTVLGSITDILVTEFGVSLLPASLWVTWGWTSGRQQQLLAGTVGYDQCSAKGRMSEAQSETGVRVKFFWVVIWGSKGSS